MLIGKKGLQLLDENAGWDTLKNEKAKEKVDELKSEFLKKMYEVYGTEFEDVLADLRVLLRPPDSPDLPIHYPRPTRDVNTQHPSFEWFVGNKRRGQKQGRGELPEPQVLPLASKDKNGLGLITKDGNGGY